MAALAAPVDHYGSIRPLGKIDFYPNYGHNQPGIKYFLLSGSHSRATELFIWSIDNPGKFRTNDQLVGDWIGKTDLAKYLEIAPESVEMGYHCNAESQTSGCYYLETNSSEPWVPAEKNFTDQTMFASSIKDTCGKYYRNPFRARI